ncbi:hypothetical protein [Planococcus lenghuensis]|uniref:Uncharacterized protein n=1 Tax=Planococcus lenghuensis TaxID=2213202 RepID=A0A1Q2L5W7_9BACL|nr:hypothetical protein [Planococcus lenghuensis]AQQ55312.1 hypothetical protein B0X71_19245 [Planococcus lenghuensis]
MAYNTNNSKEMILVESFEVLKENIENNRSKLAEIVVKIAAKNLDLAVEMWSYLINHPESNLKSRGFRFTNGLMFDLEKKVGVEKVHTILKDNQHILEACYGISDSIYYYGIFDMIKFGEIEMADKSLELLNLNRYKENSFASYLEDICEAFVEEFKDINDFDEDWDDRDEHDQKVALASDGSSVLLKWVKTITNKEQKARLNVTLIDYV